MCRGWNRALAKYFVIVLTQFGCPPGRYLGNATQVDRAIDGVFQIVYTFDRYGDVAGEQLRIFRHLLGRLDCPVGDALPVKGGLPVCERLRAEFALE